MIHPGANRHRRRHTDTDTHRHTETHTETLRDTQTHRDTQRHSDTPTHTDTHRHTDRHGAPYIKPLPSDLKMWSSPHVCLQDFFIFLHHTFAMSTDTSDFDDLDVAPCSTSSCKAGRAPRKRRKGRSTKPRSQVQPLHPPVDNAKLFTNAEWTETSDSEETVRIATSQKNTASWAKTATENDDDDADLSAESSSDLPNSMSAITVEGPSSHPTSSGCFHYTEWLCAQLSHEQLQQVLKDYTYMDFCAGFGTSFLANHAIKRAMNLQGVQIEGMGSICQVN